MKAKTLIMAALLGIGLASCSKEDDAIAPSNSTVISNDNNIPTGNAEKHTGNNLFIGKSYLIMNLKINKSEITLLKNFEINFNYEGGLELIGNTFRDRCVWGYNEVENNLLIRSNGRNSTTNLLTSDVWKVTSVDNGIITLDAKHFEMSKQMVIKYLDPNAPVGNSDR